MKNLFIAALILLCACKKYEESLADVNGSFSFNISDSAGAANDGVSRIRIRMSKSIEARPGVKVIFSANRGTLSDSELFFRGDTAETFLKTLQDTGIYIIKGWVKDHDSTLYEKSFVFRLRDALPDSLFLDPGRSISTMSADTPTLIKTYLFRHNGPVTLGRFVSFRSYQVSTTNDTVSVGRFSNLFNNFSKADGTLNDINFYSDTRNIDSNRVVTIEATTAGKEGSVIVRKLLLRYK